MEEESMKMILMFSFNNVTDAQQKSAELEAAGYRLDVFEGDVKYASADFRSTNGDENFTQGNLWIVIGTKSQ
jgi:hypothetical protein